MKQFWKDLLSAVIVGMVLPGIVVNAAVMLADLQRTEPVAESLPEPERSSPVWVRSGECITRMELEDYLVRVVLAEMPASFEPEALKAQSVAARTYTAKAAAGGKHGDGSICTDAACCQGYLTEEDYLQKGGTQESVDKVAAAVADTAGKVLTYEDELIEATYFSSSGGMTEDAAAVWGTEFPYLRSVSSPGEETDHLRTVSYTPEAFQKALGRTLPGTPEGWFSMITHTEGNGVASVTICGETYTGTDFRSLLNLPSTAFSVDVSANQIDITTRGYGHRVGMSQYGADAMAVAGSTYEQILFHYYPGTQLADMGRFQTDDKER